MPLSYISSPFAVDFNYWSHHQFSIYRPEFVFKGTKADRGIQCWYYCKTISECKIWAFQWKKLACLILRVRSPKQRWPLPSSSLMTYCLSYFVKLNFERRWLNWSSLLVTKLLIMEAFMNYCVIGSMSFRHVWCHNGKLFCLLNGMFLRCSFWFLIPISICLIIVKSP